jgi:predicted O-linked N-acetylglucosamine transferase (SPINDLY family)
MANSPDYGPEEILKEAKHWNKMHALPLGAEAVSHANDPNLERRLKIGYLSGDLRQHPVGFFMEPVFENHDKAVFEVHVFTTQHKADDVTDRIKDHVDQWHDAAHLNPQALAEAIREEGIDILTDLTGHAAFNRYLTLARRPAPVQILGVGNFCTSGLDCVDGLLSDRFETPEGTDGHYSEPLIRLPDDFICYRPPDYAADVGPSPCLNNGYITFGCFNNLAKISGPAIALWAEILKQVPESRLLLKTMALASERARARLKSLFTVHGVSEDRILLEPGVPHRALFAEYGRVDIGLDPFPYSGGLTTIEALWMGVPVVTLSGETFASRHSTSHLNNSGLVELVCEDPVAYVSKVLEIAADFEALNALHLSIRPKLAASPILDSNRYTRNLERIFRQLWHEWCKKTSS